MKEINNTNAKDGSRLRVAPLDSTIHRTTLCQAAAKVVSALALTLVLTSDGQAQTTVCGTISGQTWTKAKSPYLVTCDLTISTLTIQPGVEVIFQSNYVFEVQGWLKANGTAAEPIVFTGTNGGWQGIYFNLSPPVSQLTHCKIEWGVNSGVRIHGTTVAISDCTFRKNSASGYQGGGLNSDSDLVLTRCVFSANTSERSGGGVRTDGALTLASCSVVGNIVASSYDGYGGGIYCDRLTAVGSVISSNSVTGNSATHGYAFGGGVRTITLSASNSVIAYNKTHAAVRNNNYAALSKGAGIIATTGVVANCVFAYNSATAVGTIHTDIGGADVWSSAGASNELAVANSIFWGSAPEQLSGYMAVTYSDVQSGYGGQGNISYNPFFAAPAAGDFHLLEGSPCIDAGNPAAAFNDACFPPSFGPPQGYTVRNDMGAYGGPGACNWAQCDAPTIASQPQGQSSCLGQGATFCVTASGTPPLNYQWRFNGSPISGKTNDCLTLVNLQSSNAGPYSVVVSSACGSVTSSVAPLVVNDACVDLCMYAGLNIAGLPGRTYELRYTTDLSNTNFATWTFLATNTTPWFYIDTTSCGVPNRFYGVKLLP